MKSMASIQTLFKILLKSNKEISYDLRHLPEDGLALMILQSNLNELNVEELEDLVSLLITPFLHERIAVLHTLSLVPQIDMTKCNLIHCDANQIALLQPVLTKNKCPELEAIIAYQDFLKRNTVNNKNLIEILNQIFNHAKNIDIYQYRFFDMFVNSMKSRSMEFYKILAVTSNRFYLTALILSNIFEAERIDILSWFSKKSFYREGLYNRKIENTLLKLLYSPLSTNCKKYFVEHCIISLNHLVEGLKKSRHYEVWSLLDTLVDCKIDAEMEDFATLNNPKSTLTDLYWAGFRSAFPELKVDYSAYQQHFNHPLHYMFLAFCQNINKPELKKMADILIKTILESGLTGYRALRYKKEHNSHLQMAFHDDKDAKLQLIWSTSFDPIIIEADECKGYSAHDIPIAIEF